MSERKPPPPPAPPLVEYIREGARPPPLTCLVCGERAARGSNRCTAHRRHWNPHNGGYSAAPGGVYASERATWRLPRWLIITARNAWPGVLLVTTVLLAWRMIG